MQVDVKADFNVASVEAAAKKQFGVHRGFSVPADLKGVGFPGSIRLAMKNVKLAGTLIVHMEKELRGMVVCFESTPTVAWDLDFTGHTDVMTSATIRLIKSFYDIEVRCNEVWHHTLVHRLSFRPLFCAGVVSTYRTSYAAFAHRSILSDALA